MLKKLMLLLIAFSASSSYAGLIITGTRVIYPAQQKNVNVQISNVGTTPALMQTWIDNGQIDAAPDQIQTPFVITPPISRIEANKGQTIRITHTGEALPKDRESVFYLNVLDIPPKPQGEKAPENYLQIAVRSRIKLFYRPQNFPFPVEQAYEKVQWRLSGKNDIIAKNPTPYFITYQDIAVHQNGHTIDVKETGMVAPFSEKHFALKQAIRGGSVNWRVINDYGTKVSGNSNLH